MGKAAFFLGLVHSVIIHAAVAAVAAPTGLANPTLTNPNQVQLVYSWPTVGLHLVYAWSTTDCTLKSGCFRGTVLLSDGSRLLPSHGGVPATTG